MQCKLCITIEVELTENNIGTDKIYQINAHQKYKKQQPNNNQNYTKQWSINFYKMKSRFRSLFLHCMYLCRQRGLWLSNIDEEQSEECCNGVLERERSRLMNGAHSVSPRVSGSFQDDNLCTTQWFLRFSFTTRHSHLPSHSSLSSLFPPRCPSSFLLSSSLTSSQTRVPDLSWWLDTRTVPCCCGM